MTWLVAALEWQSRAVVARHLRVYMRNWYTAFLPPALEPVTMLLAFGVGLGGYVNTSYPAPQKVADFAGMDRYG